MARRITDLQKSIKEMHAEMSVIVSISKEVSSESDRDTARAQLTAASDAVRLLHEGQKSYYTVEMMYGNDELFIVIVVIPLPKSYYQQLSLQPVPRGFMHAVDSLLSHASV
jgi:hypothetical protein